MQNITATCSKNLTYNDIDNIRVGQKITFPKIIYQRKLPINTKEILNFLFFAFLGKNYFCPMMSEKQD